MELIISPDFHGVRLDRFIRKKYRETALSEIYRLIRTGRVRVNRKKKKPDYRLQENDVVRVDIGTLPSSPRKRIPLSPEQRRQAAASIVYEDNNIGLCNKPPGLAMHRGSGHEYGFVELLQAYMKNPQFTFVNRIDKATSGLVIGAKNLMTARKLSELFRQQAIEKYYAILVAGVVDQDSFTITSYLKKEDERVQEYTEGHQGAKKAVSSFSVLRRYPRSNATLLEARLLTGRTHQLRVQLAGRHHPIIGDMKYGNRRAGNMLLFSRRVVIPAFNLDVSLPVPDFFKVA